MSNHTEEAVKAAERLQSATTTHHREWWTLGRLEQIECIATMIEEETNLPELKRQRDELREAGKNMLECFVTDEEGNISEFERNGHLYCCYDDDFWDKTIIPATRKLKAPLATVPPKSEGEGRSDTNKT